MRHLFASLTSRLVLTAVALVVLVAVLIGVAATAALNAQLTHQLDDDLRHAAGTRTRTGAGPGTVPQRPPGDEGEEGDEFEQRGRGPRTLLAHFDGAVAEGVILGTGPGDSQAARPTTQLDGAAGRTRRRRHPRGRPARASAATASSPRTDGGEVEVTGLPTAAGRGRRSPR